jgi:hypothetical protein
MELRAIETVYKGYRFRSRLEARWAVFFDALGIPWEYEKEGFDLGNGVRYLPDFWLPEARFFVEVKGQQPTAEEVAKLRALDNNPPEYALGATWAIGVPEVPVDNGAGDWSGNTWHILQRSDRLRDLRVPYAVRKARQARFEHGECP